MKASGSGLSSLIAAVYFAAHIAFLAPSLEDIDSINFALGLRDYDVANHQPHPPGYPVYIVLGRASLAAVKAVAPGRDDVSAEALALAVWSAFAGAAALVAAYGVFRALHSRAAIGSNVQGRAVWGAALLAVAPLFWLTGLRPLSDMPGLALALTAQWLMLDERRMASQPSSLLLAALLSAFAIGIRVQTAVLTLPLLAVVAVATLSNAPKRVAGAALAFVVGCLAWAVPMLAASGGLEQYRAALDFQADADFAWVDMLWANPTPARLALSLHETFVLPWAAVPLAVTVGAVAFLGAALTAIRAPRTLALLAVAFGPYVVFHLLFQETLTVRYALPVMPAIVWLAVQGLAPLARFAVAGAAALAGFAALVSVPGGIVYAREVHPAFVAIRDMSAAASAERPYALYSHHSVRRPIQAQKPTGVRFIEPEMRHEWRGPVEYWRSGGDGSVWFLADSRRTDLALIDPEARRQVASYRWPAGDRPELSGTRPPGVDWYRFRSPGWFAGEGWSLTPELGGLTELARNGVDHRPIEAMVRRRPEAMVAVIGARHLGTAAMGGVTFTLAIDGQEIDRWPLDPARGPNVVRFVHLPAGALTGSGPYAALAIRSEPIAAGGTVPPVAIRQFNIQPESGLVYAFDEGWHEEEYNNMTGLRWRWSSGRSTLRIAPAQGIRLRMRGESPLKYFDTPPTARVRAGGRVIGELQPSTDFEWSVTVPGDDVRRGDSAVILEVEPVYLPGAAEGTADTRQLGLRLFEIDVHPLRD